MATWGIQYKDMLINGLKRNCQLHSCMCTCVHAGNQCGNRENIQGKTFYIYRHSDSSCACANQCRADASCAVWYEQTQLAHGWIRHSTSEETIVVPSSGSQCVLCKGTSQFLKTTRSSEVHWEVKPKLKALRYAVLGSWYAARECNSCSLHAGCTATACMDADQAAQASKLGTGFRRPSAVHQQTPGHLNLAPSSPPTLVMQSTTS